MESLADDTGEIKERRRVGLVYDKRMCKHSTPKKEYHPENPGRIRAVWKKLMSAGIPQRCVVFKAIEVEDKYIEAVHAKSHINLIKTISSKKTISQRNKVAAKYDSIYFNEGSSESAYLAAGSLLEVAEKVAKGELNSAFAIVRPPGHHAEKSEPMGFCLFNNVAIAASFLLDQKKLGIKKILIVDWDVHHGNATQKMFWKDSRVLSFSVHRHENGSFYPGGDDGSYTMVGEGPGLGYNINVPWENAQCEDADYIAVWDHILIPVAKEFNPDIILISAGFDAAIGDPLGDCCVTPHGFSILLKKLMKFSKGKIVMALEGGYNLDSLAKSVLACIEVLLEDNPIADSYEVYPFESTWRVIKDVRGKLSKFWPILATKLPKKLTDRVKPLPETYSPQSDVEEDCVPDTLIKKRKCQTLSVGNSIKIHEKPDGTLQPPKTQEEEVAQLQRALQENKAKYLADVERFEKRKRGEGSASKVSEEETLSQSVDDSEATKSKSASASPNESEVELEETDQLIHTPSESDSDEDKNKDEEDKDDESDDKDEEDESNDDKDDESDEDDDDDQDDDNQEEDRIPTPPVIPSSVDQTSKTKPPSPLTTPQQPDNSELQALKEQLSALQTQVTTQQSEINEFKTYDIQLAMEHYLNNNLPGEIGRHLHETLPNLLKEYVKRKLDGIVAHHIQSTPLTIQIKPSKPSAADLKRQLLEAIINDPKEEDLRKALIESIKKAEKKGGSCKKAKLSKRHRDDHDKDDQAKRSEKRTRMARPTATLPSFNIQQTGEEEFVP